MWLAAAIMLMLIANLAVLAIAQRRAEGETIRALTEAGCRCETWREGIHWPGCPILGGMQPDPRTIDDVIRGTPIREAAESAAIWLEAEAEHPREDPRPAMRLQAKILRDGLERDA